METFVLWSAGLHRLAHPLIMYECTIYQNGHMQVHAHVRWRGVGQSINCDHPQEREQYWVLGLYGDRVISLLSVAGNSRTDRNLGRKGPIIPESQFGFRPGHDFTARQVQRNVGNMCLTFA